MIHVLITVKESERFPGKNRFLAPYTIVWLLNEIAYVKEQVQVYTVGKRSELPLRLPNNWKHIKTACKNHLEDILSAETQIKPASDDVIVLAQVTQPIREAFLLDRAIKCIQEGNSSLVTASEHVTSEWRDISQGKWGTKIEAPRLKLNGQLYAWRPGHAGEIFNPTAEHAVLLTRTSWGLVDVDTKKDIPPNLSAIAGHMLYDTSVQSPIVLKNKRILLIGSGKDIVGRKMGSIIDSGFWDVVVRLNHYYGTEEDVGTRTDLAVIREARFESRFIDEAPSCPSHVITTNDGPNFPKKFLQIAAQETEQPYASIGVIAGRWLLSHNPAQLAVIGIGHYPDGSWEKQKTYPDGTKDTSDFYDWNKENAWWEARKDIIRLL